MHCTLLNENPYIGNVELVISYFNEEIMVWKLWFGMEIGYVTTLEVFLDGENLNHN